MRTGVKIKVSFVFLAWLAAFAHSVIPHNHEENSSLLCDQLVHECSTEGTSNHGSPVVNSADSESNICHLSNFLFHNLNQEDFYPLQQDFISHLLECSAKSIFSETDQVYISNYSNSGSQLRAPPAV